MPLERFSEVHPFIQIRYRVDSDGTDLMPLVDLVYTRFRIDAILAVSTDTVDAVLNLFVQFGDDGQPIGQCTIPARTGKDGSPSLDLIPLFLPSTVTGLVFPPGATLQAETEVALSTGAVLSLVCLGGLL